MISSTTYTRNNDPDGLLLAWSGSTYGFTVSETLFGGGQNRWSVLGCATQKQAFDDAVLIALEHGWTPPRWWQVWRLGDKPKTISFSDHRKPQYLSAIDGWPDHG